MGANGYRGQKRKYELTSEGKRLIKREKEFDHNKIKDEIYESPS